MRIGIFGRHPVPQPGFMGVMSLFEAKYFARLHNEVELLIPFHTEADLDKLLAANDVDSLNQLPKFDANFEIVPVFVGRPLGRDRYDAIVYQSYDAEDWANFHPALRRHCRILTKSFPKFVPGTANVWHPDVEHQFKAFDLVACALRSDIEELQGDTDFWRKYGHKAAYVPRGADPTLLHPARKYGGRPTIGIDMPPCDAGIAAIQHYEDAIHLLRQRVPDLRVLTLGQAIPDIGSECVSYGRFDHIYDRFFNEIWILLTMNYARSPNHVLADVQAMHPDGWKGRALYELQNVEAQMAGAVLFGHPANLIDELMQTGSTGFTYPDYNDAQDISDRLFDIISDYDTARGNARRWAERNFSWPHCIKLWHDALEAALYDSDHSRADRQTYMPARPLRSCDEADQLYQSGDHLEAEQAYQSLLATSMPGSGWCLFQIGRIAVRQGRWSEAITHLDAALATANPVVWAHWEKAIALRQIGAETATIAGVLARFAQNAPLDLAEAHYAKLVTAANEASDAGSLAEAKILYDLLAERRYAAA
jgi:glycosyltransferase involved in cell wall biosynthesis